MCNERQSISLIITRYKNVKALKQTISPHKDILGSGFWGVVREFLAGQNQLDTIQGDVALDLGLFYSL